MDLSTIEQKLEDSKYTSLNEVNTTVLSPFACLYDNTISVQILVWGLIAVIQSLMMGLFVFVLQFTADMKLMFENCLDYNGADSSK